MTNSLTEDTVVPMLIHLPEMLKDRLRAARRKTGTPMGRLIKEAIERFLDADGHLDVEQIQPTWQRILAFLWANSHTRYGDRTNDPDEKIVPLSLKQIARLARVNVATLANALHALEQRGCVLREQRRGWGGRRTIVLLKTVEEASLTPGSAGVRKIGVLKPAEQVVY